MITVGCAANSVSHGGETGGLAQVDLGRADLDLAGSSAGTSLHHHLLCQVRRTLGQARVPAPSSNNDFMFRLQGLNLAA